MKRKRDPLPLTPHWHVGCQIEAELPEDNIVGRRFLVNMIFTAVAAGLLLYAGWLGYVSMSLRHQIRDWERRMDDNRSEVRDIQRMQREYATEAAKIDQAYALVRPQLFVSGFVADIGRTKPEQMTIDIIEWNAAGIVIRGSVRETSERASRIVGGYVELLRKDEAVAPLFREIVPTSIDRGTGGDMLKFEISLRLKPAKT